LRKFPVCLSCFAPPICLSRIGIYHTCPWKVATSTRMTSEIWARRPRLPSGPTVLDCSFIRMRVGYSTVWLRCCRVTPEHTLLYVVCVLTGDGCTWTA
jgi:hypothetical protein